MAFLSEYNYISKQMYCCVLFNKTIEEQSYELKRNPEASDAQNILQSVAGLGSHSDSLL